MGNFSPLMADIELQTSITDVWYRGTNEQTGSITVSIDDDDFTGVSPENPIFIRITPDRDSQLARTLVDQSLSVTDYRADPIYLAMTLRGEDDKTLVAAPDTVSIVRWVEGESAIWLRIQSDGSGWISDGETAMSPNLANVVSFTLAISARHSAEIAAGYESGTRNLPFNTRDPHTDGDTDDATSTVLCVDLSKAGLDITGLEALLRFDIIAYDANADLGGGFYSGQAGSPTGIDFTSDFLIARGKARIIPVIEPGSPDPATRRSADNNLETITRILPLLISTVEDGPYLDTFLHPGSTVVLTAPEEASYGFDQGSVRFLVPSDNCSGPEPSELILSEPFTLEGQTYYKRAELIWDGSPQDLDAFLLEIEATLTSTRDYPETSVDFEVWVQPGDDGTDEAPFSGVDQDRSCGSVAFQIYQNTWLIDNFTRTIGHVTLANGDFTTDLVIGNSSNEDREIVLSGYDTEGIMIGELTRSIAAGETETHGANELFASESVSHIRVMGSGSIEVAAVYRAISEQAVPCQVWAGTEQSRHWLLATGDRALTYDGLAVVNVGGEPTAVTAIFRDGDGEILADPILIEELAANGKALFNIGAAPYPTDAATVEILADRPLVVTALRGDYQSTYLWQNRSQPLN